MSELVNLQKTLYNSVNPTRRWLHGSRRAWIIDAINRHAPMERGGAAIEIGPGSGVYLPSLLARFEACSAVDIEEPFLAQSRRIAQDNNRLSVERRDLTDPRQMPEAVYDLVLCSEVVEHVPPTCTERAFQSLRKGLKTGGILVLSTPQRWSLLELTARFALSPLAIGLVRLVYKEPVLPLGHINLMTKKQVKGHLVASGFNIIEHHIGGLYLPVLAELGGQSTVRVEKSLEAPLRRWRLGFLLWTQYYVARAI